jgi:regulation of enolase protein 1 (concanavalin A-like superfamily)
LTWTDTSNNESRFSVDRSTSSNMASPTTFTVAARSGTGTASYTDSGLTEGTKYYYRIRSLIDAGSNYSTYYPLSSYPNATTAPAAPTGMAATVISGTQINLSWTDNSNNETVYELERATNTGFTSGLTQINITSNTGAGTGVRSYSNTGLTAGTTYYYRVRSSIGGTNDSADSSTVQGLPSGWITADVGAVGATGTAAYDVNGTFTIEGSGEWIYSTADEFRYVYQQASGDCSIVARVTSIEDVASDDWSQAGVMIRETLNAGSKHGLALVAYNQQAQFIRRTATNGTSDATNESSFATPYWVRMVRSGNTLTASRSANGSSWTTIGSATISMTTNVYIGLAVNANEDGQLCTATFDNVTATLMRAAGGEVTGRDVEALTQDALDPVAAAAMARWEAVLRATSIVNASASNNAFASVEFVIADLAGDVLGMTVGSTIYLDRDAAGYGWYTDALFAKNLNFLDAKEGAGMDLLTVVSHELGHVLGLGHSQRGVMSETLEEGTRMLPSWSDVHRSSGIRGRALAAALDAYLDSDVDLSDELLIRV